MTKNRRVSRIWLKIFKFLSSKHIATSTAASLVDEMRMSKTFENLKKFFTSLPGVGPRQASRFIISLLRLEEKDLVEFARLIANLKQEVKICKDCSFIAEKNLCHICQDSKRNAQQIMVVEKISDLEAIEKTNHYKGKYHVLGGTLNPIDGVGEKNLTIDNLIRRIGNLIQKPAQLEIILALSPTPLGDSTAFFIIDKLKPLREKIKLTKLGRGLSFGSFLEYVDENTLKEAFERRS